MDKFTRKLKRTATLNRLQDVAQSELRQQLLAAEQALLQEQQRGDQLHNEIQQLDQLLQRRTGQGQHFDPQFLLAAQNTLAAFYVQLSTTQAAIDECQQQADQLRAQLNASLVRSKSLQRQHEKLQQHQQHWQATQHSRSQDDLAIIRYGRAQ